MKTNLLKFMHDYFQMILVLTIILPFSLHGAYAQSCAITGASATLYGQPCGKVDAINFGSTGSLTGLTNGVQYKYSIALQTPNQVTFNGLKIGGAYVNQNTPFVFTGSPMNLEWDLTVPCSWACGYSRTITLYIKSHPLGAVICSKVYTIKAPITWLTASPSATNCSNVPVTVTYNSQASSIIPNCVFTVYNSNPGQWKINGQPVSTYQLIAGSSVTVTNYSNTSSSTTIAFGDGSLCSCCAAACGTPSITLTSLVSPIANAGPDKSHCCYVTLGTSPQANTTYSWSPTTGLNNPNIAQPTTFATNITYTLTTTYTPTGCTAQDQVYVGFKSGNCCKLDDSNTEILTSLISIFPNPSNEFFVLDVSETEIQNTTLEVMDILGKSVIKINDINKSEKIQFGHQLPAGVYYAIINGEKKLSFKIVKY